VPESGRARLLAPRTQGADARAKGTKDHKPLSVGCVSGSGPGTARASESVRGALRAVRAVRAVRSVRSVRGGSCVQDGARLGGLSRVWLSLSLSLSPHSHHPCSSSTILFHPSKKPAPMDWDEQAELLTGSKAWFDGFSCPKQKHRRQQWQLERDILLFLGPTPASHAAFMLWHWKRTRAKRQRRLEEVA
jgi:hypothetical protein